MNPLYTFGVYVVWFLSTYFVVLLLLLIAVNKNRLYEKRKPLSHTPSVSIIVPAYNEEAKIADTIASLKKITYPAIEFIIVNDGSKDATNKVITTAIAGDARFLFIDRAYNKGKAASLNEGIEHAKGVFVACMDADSIVEPDIFQKALPYFDEPKTGAVTVTVELRNPNTFLQKMIDIEYIIGLSLFLKIFSLLDCVFVTPGPFSIYRRSLLAEIGCFDPTNITEDHEIAYRIHKHGYAIANCLEAKVYTLTPDTFKGIYVQRRRWYSGALQTVFQHRDVLFNKKLGLFGYFTPFNYLLISSGMIIFYTSTYLGLSHLLENLWYYHYTNFNFFEHFWEFHFDILRFGRISMIGLSALVFTVLLMFTGLWFSKKPFATKKLGMLGFPLMFFLYQIFWTGAMIAVLRRKKITWR